jgi:hypothetical protein
LDLRISSNGNGNGGIGRLGWLVIGLLGFIVIAQVVGIISGGILISRQSERAQADADMNAKALYDNCTRGVASRERLIDVFDGALRGNKQRREAWKFYRDNVATPGQAVTGAPVEQFASEQIHANQVEVDALRVSLLNWIRDATEDISAHPHSHNPHQVNEVDCATQFPPP